MVGNAKDSERIQRHPKLAIEVASYARNGTSTSVRFAEENLAVSFGKRKTEDQGDRGIFHRATPATHSPRSSLLTTGSLAIAPMSTYY